MSDLYRVLGVRRGAPRKDIHTAYRRKAKMAHPDGGGSVEAFNELVLAYGVLSDPKRRRRYDETGEIDPPRPDNFDGGAIEIIAEKLGLVIHAEHDLSSTDVGALIEQAIRDDIAGRKGSIAHQRQAAQRLARLRGRARRKAQGEDNLVARVLDWHELAIENRIKKHEESVRFLERALDILQDYSFADDLAVAQADDVSGALNDILVALDELAVILNTSPARAEAMPRGAAPTAFG